jgi:nicotinamidase-related amidase
MTSSSLPIPSHYDAARVGDYWRVPYGDRAVEARAWAGGHGIVAAHLDAVRTGLLIIDAQNTFCLPEFELFVGGRSGVGAVEDNQRLCEFIYRNLGCLTEIIPTLDTHGAAQIFHPLFWVDRAGNAPAPMTMVSLAAVEAGDWQVNPAIAATLPHPDPAAFALHYVRQLSQAGKYPLTIWPYHSMLGGIGHALVAAVEEACFFHSVARYSPTRFELKGSYALTENYSVLRPEVMEGPSGEAIAPKNQGLIRHLLGVDRLYIAGQAKSHCVAWTIADLLTEIEATDPKLAQKVYLLTDCTSPVVVPGVVDYTEAGEEAFARFAAAGMKLVLSTEAL